MAKEARRFTATQLAAKPEGVYGDPAQPGLQFRVREGKRGTSRTWVFRYAFNNRPGKFVLGTFPAVSITDARKLVQRYRDLMRQGINPQNAVPKKTSQRAVLTGNENLTVNSVAEEYITRELRVRHKTRQEEYWIRKDILPVFGNRDLRSLTARECVSLRDQIEERNAHEVAKKVYRYLGNIFDFAILRGLIDSNPIIRIKRKGKGKEQSGRDLSDDELKAFFSDPVSATRRPRLAHALAVLLLTGQRRGELARAKWTDIDSVKKTWTIPDENSKSGRGHICPLTDWAMQEFDALRNLAGTSPWVLPAKDPSNPIDPKLLTRGVSRNKKYLGAKGIGDFKPHDCRRTAYTTMVRLGTPINIVEKVVNHKETNPLLLAYNRHDYAQEKRKALTDLEQFYLTLVNPDDQEKKI